MSATDWPRCALGRGLVGFINVFSFFTPPPHRLLQQCMLKSRDIVKKMRTAQKEMLRVLGTHRGSLLEMIRKDAPEEAQEAVLGLKK